MRFSPPLEERINCMFESYWMPGMLSMPACTLWHWLSHTISILVAYSYHIGRLDFMPNAENSQQCHSQCQRERFTRLFPDDTCKAFLCTHQQIRTTPLWQGRKVIKHTSYGDGNQIMKTSEHLLDMGTEVQAAKLKIISHMKCIRVKTVPLTSVCSSSIFCVWQSLKSRQSGRFLPAGFSASGGSSLTGGWVQHFQIK